MDSKVYQRDRWFQLIEYYSSRHLTNENDKLPALAGLAADFAQRHHYGDHEYLAGIWSSQLPSALLWNAVASQPWRPQANRAPSWSWASLNGAISYDSLKLSNEGFQRKWESTCLIEITDWDCPPIKALQSLIKPSSAVLRVRGLIAELNIGSQLPQNKGSKTSHRLLSKDGETVGILCPDLPRGLMESTSVYVLRIEFELYYGFIACPIEMDEESRGAAL